VICELFPLIGILCFTCLALTIWIVICSQITIQIDKARHVKHRIPIKGNSSQITIQRDKARHVKHRIPIKENSFPLIGILCFRCLALSLWIVIFVLFPLIGILCFTCLAQRDKTRYVKHRIPIKGNGSQIQIVKARHVKQIIPINGNSSQITINIDKARHVKHRIPIKGNRSQSR
jgi:uncharacterized membrane protein YdbT with pleckstrin-like domain